MALRLHCVQGLHHARKWRLSYGCEMPLKLCAEATQPWAKLGSRARVIGQAHQRCSGPGMGGVGGGGGAVALQAVGERAAAAFPSHVRSAPLCWSLVPRVLRCRCGRGLVGGGRWDSCHPLRAAATEACFSLTSPPSSARSPKKWPGPTLVSTCTRAGEGTGC